MEWSRSWVLLLVPLLGWHVLSFSRTVQLVLKAKAARIVPEPPGLAEVMRAQTAPTLTPEDLEALERDGVIRVRGVVNASALKGLEPLLWDHAQDMNHLTATWYYNGAVRALLRDSPLMAVAAQALGSDILSGDMQVWSKGGGSPDEPRFAHSDDRWHIGKGHAGLLSVWFAVTNAPGSMRFYKGSHRHVEELYRLCGLKPDEGIESDMHKECVEDFAATNITRELGYDSVWQADAAAGDAFLFYSHVAHIGHRQTDRRTAVCVRAQGGPFVDDRSRCLRDEPFDRHNRIRLHPPGEIDCVPWQLVPEMGVDSPVVSRAPRWQSTYWAHIYRAHLTGQFRLVQRSEHSLPSFAEMLDDSRVCSLQGVGCPKNSG